MRTMFRLAALALSAPTLAMALQDCRRPVPEPPHVDAGLVAIAVAVDAGAGRAPVMARRPPSGRQDIVRRRALRGHAAAPVDERVSACVREAKDRDGLMGCLGSFDAPAPKLDAGAAPKFAALAPVPPAKTSWLVPLWYVNASTGSDELNTCVTSGSPCKTFAEIVRRWQTDSPFFSGGVTVQIMADMPQSDTINWTPWYDGASGNATLAGTGTVIATGTLASVVAKNQSASQPLQANLGSTGRVGLEICDSTHPSCAQVGLSVSGTTYTLAQPTDVAFSEVDTWANGDVFTLYQEPKAYLAHVANITVDTVWKFQPPFSIYAEATDFINGRVDDSAQINGTLFVALSNEYSHGLQSIELVDGSILGGFSRGPIMASINNDAEIANDAIIDFEADLSGSGRFTIQGAYSTSGTLWHMGGAQTEVAVGSPATGPMYGPSYQVDSAHGRVIYSMGEPPTASAALSFLGGATLTIDSTSFGKACDRAHTPEQCLPRVALTPAQLDATFASGGFDGVAISPDTNSGFVAGDKLGFWPSVSNLCGAGLFMTGNPSSPCGTPAGTGCATCTTVIAGTNITVTGGPAYTVSTTFTPFTWPSDDIAYGNGTTTPNFLAPSSTVGLPLVSQGSSSPPAYAVAVVAGGGTGVSSGTAHTVATFQGTSPMAGDGPGASGDVLTGSGSSADPVFSTPAGDAHGPITSLVVDHLLGHLINTPAVGAVVFDGSQFQFSLPLTATFGGTDVTSAGVAFNELVSTGSGWSSQSGPKTFFSGAHSISLTSTGTFFTLATVSDSTTPTLTYSFHGAISCSNAGPTRITFGIAINSTTGLTWAHNSDISASGSAEYATGAVDFSTTLSGSNTINLLAESVNSGSVCDGDLSILRTLQ